MTTRPIVSIAQLDALEAAAENTVFHAPGAATWWLDVGEGRTPHAVTMPVRMLLERGLLEEGPVGSNGAIPAVVTQAGRELLDDLASRAPSGKA